ncbi:MAG TPA: PAS domain S-box protein, partial [Anaerolineales bacterium]|nr:PAS domain S-box protein [Anaerolineales bacterium]
MAKAKPPSRKNKDMTGEKEHQHLIEAILDVEPGIVYIHDLQTNKHVFINRDWLTNDTYKTAQNQADENLLPNLIHPEDLPRVTAHYDQLRTSSDEQGVHQMEYRVLQKNGEWRWVQSRDTIFSRNAQGEVTQILGILYDITESKQADEQMYFQAGLLAQVNDAIIASDENSRITTWNSAAELMYGWKADEVIGQIGAEIVKTEFNGLNRADVLNILATEGKWRGEVTQARRDGSRFFVETASIVLRNMHGVITGYASVNRDITARRQAEEKLARQNKRLTVLREIDAAILAADSIERIVDAALSHVRQLIECKRAAVILFDWEKQEAVFYNVQTEGETANPKGTRIPLASSQWMIQIVSKNQPLVINELTMLPEPIPQVQQMIQAGFHSICILPLFVQNSLIGVFSMSSEMSGFFDSEKMDLGREVANQVSIAITQSRLVSELEEHLREREILIADLTAKNTELERFIYTVSHELKSPLVTINGYLGYLEQDAVIGNLERIREDTQRISSAVENMKELLNDLLDLSRIGRLMNPSQKIPFEEVVRDALEIAHGQLEAHSIAVHSQLDLPIVYGDRLRLTEILQNLLDNAAKYMGEQPAPTIEIGQQEDAEGQFIFFVRDNGIGIAPEYHERIFGLFDKLDSRSEGTGVGLALVKRIIEFHGGRIWVESEGVP